MSATVTNTPFVTRPKPAMPNSPFRAVVAWVAASLKARQTRRLVERIDNHIRADIGLGPAPVTLLSSGQKSLISNLIAMR